MGVESGGRGRVPHSRKISGGRSPPRQYDISVFFVYTYDNFAFSDTCNIELVEIRGETKFSGQVDLGAYESVPPPQTVSMQGSNKITWKGKATTSPSIPGLCACTIYVYNN